MFDFVRNVHVETVFCFVFLCSDII